MNEKIKRMPERLVLNRLAYNNYLLSSKSPYCKSILMGRCSDNEFVINVGVKAE